MQKKKSDGSILKEELFTSLESAASKNVTIQTIHSMTFLLPKRHVKFMHKEQYI